MHIYYKIIKGVYYCFGTLNGYDYSFEGNTIHVAVEKMKAKVSELFLANKVTWHIEHPTSVSDGEEIIKPPVTYKKNRIDNL